MRMRRDQTNGWEAFKEITEQRDKGFEDEVSRRRADLDNEWEAVETEWTELEKRMVQGQRQHGEAKHGGVAC